MPEELINAQLHFEQGNFDACKDLIKEVLNRDSTNINALMLRAKISFKLQQWGETLNDLNQILELDSQHQLAQSYRQMVLNILTFWNKDNYNP
ncbi:MAG: hypothetical protein JXR22_10310 [Prolixibacteraceae bacterium]|nr:hypothetical protein [Prolixibacteraceae bacterium]